MSEAAPLHCLLVCDGAAATRLLALEVAPGSSVATLLQLAHAHWPELQRELQVARVGIWGQECTRARLLQDGDRVEIYRELLHDPKAARRQRAADARRPGAVRRRAR